MGNWQIVGTVILTEQWQLINVDAELIRVTHFVNGSSDTRFLKAAISKGTIDSAAVNIYKPQLLSYRQEPEIFLLESPIPILNNLAIRRLDSKDVFWRVRIEKYTGSVNQNTFIADAIIERLMSIFSEITNTVPSIYKQVPNFITVDLTDGQTTLLLPENPNRRKVTIRNSNRKDIVLGFTVDDNDDLVEEWDLVPRKGRYVLEPSPDGSLYIGAIYAKSEFTGTIYICEFTKGDLLE